jgi:glyoxylase-like metal-dependent hydrolase (beta-lactamase superfamily II)
VEIVPGVHLLQLTFVNAFLVDAGGELVLVDAGIPGGDRKILAYFKELRRASSELASIAITHCHIDHIGGLAGIALATGAQVCASETDAAVIAGQSQQFRPPPNRPMRILGRALNTFIKPSAVRVDRILRDGDRVGPLVAVASPGHTAGHLSFYWPERRTLFAGDSMVTQPRLRGPLEDFTEDMAEATRSVRRLAKLDIDTLCVAHGAPILAGAGVALRRMAEALP